MFQSIQDWFRERIEPKIQELEVESTGRNETFRHGTYCTLPTRPCGCMPTWAVKRETNGSALIREFWVTPHPNRRMRRQAAMAVKRGWL